MWELVGALTVIALLPVIFWVLFRSSEGANGDSDGPDADDVGGGGGD